MVPRGKDIFSKRVPLSKFEWLSREARKRSPYVPRPDKIENRRRFISLARELSAALQADVDVKECSYSVNVKLYLTTAAYAGAPKQMLSELLGMCDHVCCFPLEAGPFDLLLALDYDTHTITLPDAGRKKQKGRLFPF